MILSKKDKNLLMLLIPLLLVACSYFFVFTPETEKVNTLRQEVNQLESEYEFLLGKQNQKEHYIQETEALEKAFEEELKKFPSSIVQEKDLLLLQTIQEEIGIEMLQLETTLPEQNYAFSEQIERPLIGQENSIRLQLEGEYEQIKEVLEFIETYPQRLVLEELSIDYDEDEQIKGTLSFKQYAISGQEIQDKDLSFKDFEVGKENVFE